MTTIDKQRAAELLGKVSERNVVVLGDVMLDEFLWGEVTRISPEAPVPVVDIQRESKCARQPRRVGIESLRSRRGRR